MRPCRWESNPNTHNKNNINFKFGIRLIILNKACEKNNENNIKENKPILNFI